MEWFFIGVALLPVFFCPTITFNGFAVPQTLALGLLSAAGLLLGVWWGYVPTALPSILSVLFSIYMTLSLMWMHPIHNAKKEYGQQLPVQLVFLLGCTYLTWDGMRWVALAFALMTAAQSIYGYLQTQMIDPFFPPKIKGGGPRENPIGSIGNPNFLAGYFCTTIWLSIYAAASFGVGPRFRGLWLIPLGAIVMLVRTGCRAGQLAFLGSFLFFIVVAAFYGMLPISGLLGNEGVFSLMVAEGILALLFLFVAFKVNWEDFWRRPIDPKGAQVWFASFRYRLCFWIVGLFLVRERPIFGWGMWSFRREVYRMQAWLHHNKWGDFLKFDRYLTAQPREVHNDFIEHLVEFGVVGASLWFALIGVVYYMGFKFLSGASGAEFFLMLILLSSMTCTLLDAIFFFVFRLPSSAAAFWVTAAAVVALSGKEVLALGGSLPLAIIVVVVLWAPFVYYCMVTRFLASYYFSAARSSPREDKRGEYLERAIEWQPHDTLLRTYAALSIIDFDNTGANFHCMKMFTDFDGMAPQHATYFNIALCRARTRNLFEECAVFLNYGHWLHPYWPPIKDLLFARDGVGVRSRYVGGTRAVVKGNEETLWKVKALMKTRENIHLKSREVERLKEHLLATSNGNQEVMELKYALMCKEQEILARDLQSCFLSLKTVVLMEKKRLNVPDNWFYNKETGDFLAPTEVDGAPVANLLLPDCMDAVPLKLEGETGEIMDHYMFGKDAYQKVGHKPKEEQKEIIITNTEEGTDGDDAIGAAQRRENSI